MKHPLLEHDVAFQIAYLYHDSKDKLIHDTYFRSVEKVNKTKKMSLIHR